MVNKLKKLSLALTDALEVMTGKRNPMVPPKRFVNINSGDSEEIGRTFLRHFIELGGLNREDHVLDVGSG
ncbi:MAG: class I SAM-dependent methyltransferase, partial [Candidatus Moranbacteria bacterium]|nr:class I SAM-dependent methyltransferase [Candidatus Moranbacteria bacterium]